MIINIKNTMITLVQIACLTICVVSVSRADGFGPIPMSLKGAPVPEVPGLLDGHTTNVKMREFSDVDARVCRIILASASASERLSLWLNFLLN